MTLAAVFFVLRFFYNPALLFFAGLPSREPLKTSVFVKTLVANLEFDNDSIVRSAAYDPTDDFGKEIDVEGEALKNF